MIIKAPVMCCQHKLRGIQLSLREKPRDFGLIEDHTLKQIGFVIWHECGWCRPSPTMAESSPSSAFVFEIR